MINSGLKCDLSRKPCISSYQTFVSCGHELTKYRFDLSSFPPGYAGILCSGCMCIRACGELEPELDVQSDKYQLKELADLHSLFSDTLYDLMFLN